MKRIQIAVFAAMLPVLAGCYQSKTSVIEDGLALPFGDVASCRINGKTVSADFSKPVKTAAGGVIYRVGNEVLAFKRISDTLYLTQLATGGVHKFGYLLKNGDAVDVLSLKPEAAADPSNQSRAANILFKPAADDWTEMVGDRAEIEAFLMGAKLGSMRSAGECKFRKAVPADAPITKLLRLSTTREQALKIPGAEECELGDVCLPLTAAAAARLSPAEKAGFRYQVAFDPDRVQSVKIVARAVSPASALAISDDLGTGVSRVGPYDALLAFALNGIELDMLRVKEHAGDAKWVEQVKHATERTKDMPAMMAAPDFRVFRTTMLPAETLATLQGLPSSDRALAQIRQSGSPYLRMTISRAGTDKVDMTTEIVP